MYKAEFVILCIGKYSGFPNIPEFPLGKDPSVFKGKVMHSMDYSALDNESAAELIKNKSVTVVGSGKSALDIAVECANANGMKIFAQNFTLLITLSPLFLVLQTPHGIPYNLILKSLISIGVTHPCTIIHRTAHWFIPDFNVWGISLGYFYFNRFAELLVHKPGEQFFLSLVATLLSPLVRFAILLCYLIC